MRFEMADEHFVQNVCRTLNASLARTKDDL